MHTHDSNKLRCDEPTCILHDPLVFEKYLLITSGKLQADTKFRIEDELGRGESMWAAELVGDAIVVLNNPLDPTISLFDIVRIDFNGDYIETILKMREEVFLSYTGYDTDEFKETFRAVTQELSDDLGWEAEGYIVGAMSLNVPIGTEIERIEEVLSDINSKYNTDFAVAYDNDEEE